MPRTYTDWRGLVADPEVELVHIVTPPDKHAEMAIAALNAGKHVLIEKPLAVTDDEARAILEAAERAGRVAGINYVMRYNPLYRHVAQIAREGWLGALTHVGFENYASDEGLGDDHWFWDKAQSGGIFVEHGVHFFDVIGAIVGAPARRVLGQTWMRGDGTGKEDRVQAVVTYDNGVDASFYHAFNRPGALEKQTAHFAFEKGHVILDGWIPHTLHVNAIVSEDELLGLRRLLPVTVVDDEGFPPPGRAVRGNGKEYRVSHRVHARERLGDPTPVYQQAVGDVLRDLAAAVRDPAHRPARLRRRRRGQPAGRPRRQALRRDGAGGRSRLPPGVTPCAPCALRRPATCPILSVQEIETPVPTDGQVLVKVAAAAINPSDVKNVQGLMPHTTLPRTPGRDFAGVVVEGPPDWQGAEVWGTGGELGFTADGSHAEYLLLPRAAVRRRPAALFPEEAAAVGVPFVTAWATLVDAGRLTPEDTVVVIGAAGSVGGAAVQIARWRGARALGVVRDAAQAGA